jgi:NDP-sugar pyrophosphorylase family protein
MKLIVPMSGQGSRFIAAGYSTPKPLIIVEGKPIIAHVLDMFPGIEEVIFVCNQEHLANSKMAEILKSLRPKSTIIKIESKKLGPVHALTFAFPYLDDNEDVIVSYCDFTQDWDFAAFKKAASLKSFAGAVPAYTGFHPHLLRKNLYAGIKLNEQGLMAEIKEKYCFTANPEDSHHSSGIYYFGSGALLKKYSEEMLQEKDTLNGEYYVSMLYPRLLRDGLPVAVPAISHFMQWGTPEDLEEYEAWSRLVHQDLGRRKAQTDIPPTREEFVKIPYTVDTTEFKKSYTYWSDYFKKQIS